MSEEIKIDPTTIARLFHTVSFSDSENIRITKKTLALVSEYAKLFTDEAIVRSNEYRLEERRRLANSYQTDTNEISTTNEAAPTGGALDAKHLEAIAGLLVLDF
ncbi:hypothetical protein FOA43_003063 [Brettanomyces nanus]|uniref:Uncharacterized protein n=1 Tax=Eeniella nana TaxID=13502 RepID=A0A875S9G9_EENNA|nr:uncharacterized protein FOA43_003063 [Brettanomyces nanus]QPG75704.1 hypothetical protein FOA43_003063 [Brettanomyces nanus]